MADILCNNGSQHTLGTALCGPACAEHPSSFIDNRRRGDVMPQCAKARSAFLRGSTGACTENDVPPLSRPLLVTLLHRNEDADDMHSTEDRAVAI